MDTINRSNPEYVTQTVLQLVQRARTAQSLFSTFDQQRIDQAVLAVGWAIMEPERNRQLAEQAVADTGLGNVPDKIRKNHRKTLGLLRDLDGVKSTGVIRQDPASGITEIARAVGVVAAITPSTNPAQRQPIKSSMPSNAATPSSLPRRPKGPAPAGCCCNSFMTNLTVSAYRGTWCKCCPSPSARPRPPH
ncbi:succinate-semialdehyde dehydrogenase (NAD(P)(+)) [Advenella kashmirensis WT001]|uniref:Succinate-semialdehyde dehydrogenase (NAD(P)(+)) n=1 Tax=Advenella kashmirensis (strain DSM 17095 / LMG 22695 / WT001) TaxID=1036672 RepID=I3U822_ADVKW|nr:succinate-semialdehyde dehydrogenase (NAD(P)(+)) [Advenella kashmirensis WT001]